MDIQLIIQIRKEYVRKQIRNQQITEILQSNRNRNKVESSQLFKELIKYYPNEYQSIIRLCELDLTPQEQQLIFYKLLESHYTQLQFVQLLTDLREESFDLWKLYEIALLCDCCHSQKTLLSTFQQWIFVDNITQPKQVRKLLLKYINCKNSHCKQKSIEYFENSEYFMQQILSYLQFDFSWIVLLIHLESDKIIEIFIKRGVLKVLNCYYNSNGMKLECIRVIIIYFLSQILKIQQFEIQKIYNNKCDNIIDHSHRKSIKLPYYCLITNHAVISL